AFQAARDVKLNPGQTARIGRYDVTYVRPTSTITLLHGRVEKINFGAVLRVRKGHKLIATLRPERGYYPSQAVVALGPLGRFFEGDSTSEVGMHATLGRDVWTAVQPDISSLRPIIDRGDRIFTDAAGQLTPLRSGHAEREAEQEQLHRADLEAAKEAKYREIRDAELDYRTGKLSDADWKALDRELRAEAAGILRELDRLGP